MYDLNSASNLESILFADDTNWFISDKDPDLFNKTFPRIVILQKPRIIRIVNKSD